jgi:rhodanese-related sulfurtransferase
MGTIQTVNAKTFCEQIEQPAANYILDVRTPAENKSESIAGSVLIPLQDINAQLVQNKLNLNGEKHPLYLICQSGKRSEMAAKKLVNKIDNPLVIVEGGLNACKSSDILLIMGKGVISIERQVRITAGMLVLTGLLIGISISPWGFALTGFVGAGLIYAGVTDTCAMGMLLANMPWNRA